MRLRRDFVGIALLTWSISGVALDGRAQTSAAKSSAPSMAASDQRTQFAGTYRYAGGAQEDEARKAAIDHAVESMSAFTRSTARNRIQATTQIPGFYAFSFDPGKIKILPESRPQMISSDKGESADYIYNGKTSKLTQVIAGDRITQVFVSDDGRRQNEFTFSQDGKTLTLKVTVSSARLSTPVVYTLTYKKAN
jgi:hypothetical protein